MSNDPQPPESDGALDLSGLNFGPAWARDPAESKSVKKYNDQGDRSESRDRRGGGGRGDRRGGGRGDQRGGGQRGGGQRGDRRDGGGNRGKFQGGRDRHDERGPQREEIAFPEGVKVSFMPSEESLDLLAKEVTQTGRTFSVFDLAKVLLQGRDRFRVTFEHKENPFFRCREDNSLWLTKKEALSHLWRADWRKKFYEEVQIEGEAPSGSFQAVAKCGLTGKLLGPPNYHAYQQNVVALHREQFANMPLERFKSRIVMERGEEAVEAWLESMKITTQWKVAEPDAEEVADEKAPQETPAEEAAPAEEVATGEETSTSEEAPEAEVIVEVAEDSPTPAEEAAPQEASVEAEAVESPDASEEEIVLLKTAREVEQHFLENHFESTIEESKRAWVMGDIQGKNLSPGLLALLKNSVVEEKRYPANLMPIVCRQLSGRHVAVFKWEKKLKVGPSRPHAVSAKTQLAERPQAIIDYLGKNSGKKLQDLWKKFLPEDASDVVKGEWYHDLHWLLNQGHVILLSDTSLHLAKSGDVGKPSAKNEVKLASRKKAVSKEEPAAEEKPVAEEKPAAEQPAEEKKAEVPAPEPEAPVAESGPIVAPLEERPAAEKAPKEPESE